LGRVELRSRREDFILTFMKTGLDVSAPVRS
jgi:hypothetical protein